MSETAVLAAQMRDNPGRGGARAVRRSGFVPAVLYGGEGEPVNVKVEERELLREYLKGGFTNQLLDLDVGGKTVRVLPRDVQLHPVTDRAIHVDFLRVSASSTLRISVPVIFEDEEESPGIKRGGVLNVVRFEVEIVCRADAIPEQIVASLAGLEIGDGVHRDDIEWPDGVEPAIQDRNFTIATIAAPTIHVEEEEAEEGEEELEALEGEEVEAGVAEGEEAGAGSESKD